MPVANRSRLDPKADLDAFVGPSSRLPTNAYFQCTGGFSPLADLYTLAQRSNAVRIRSWVAVS